MTQPTYTAVRQALAATLAAQIPGLRTSANRNAQVNVPQVVVMPVTGSFASYSLDFQGSLRFLLRAILLVSEGDSASGQDNIDPYIATTGAAVRLGGGAGRPDARRGGAGRVRVRGHRLRADDLGRDRLPGRAVHRPGDGLMRWLVIHPGPHFSVHDLFTGWVEALRGLGQDVYTYNLGDRLNFYDAVLIETGTAHDGHPGVRKALTREQAIQLAASGITAAAYQVWPDVVLSVSARSSPPSTCST